MGHSWHGKALHDMLWAFTEDENEVSRHLAAKGGSYVKSSMAAAGCRERNRVCRSDSGPGHHASQPKRGTHDDDSGGNCTFMCDHHRCSTYGCDLSYHAYPRLPLLPVLLRKPVERPAARRGY